MSEAIARVMPGFTIQNVRGLAAPALVVMVLAMMILPLPPFVLDLLFTFNIALALLVMLVSLNTARPLDFASFPTLLLLTTLLRLSLNIASTRVVLMNGHTGPEAAGKVIESFGHFLVGGNFAVGLVVFIIMVVINFVVITKGAGRIAEVSARFTLDAMPGKQMAIDADLNSGVIGEQEARKRRTEVAQEADFYGAMDGASKFVRGDAVAGIMILAINIVGGLVIGVLQHDLPLATAANNYILLAIGDGLVAQVPALVISTAAGLVVSRVGTTDIGAQFAAQLFTSPQPFFLTGGVLGLLGLIPGMPHLPFLGLAGACVYAGRLRSRPVAEKAEAEAPVETARPATEASWDDVRPVDMLGLEVGYRLISSVDRNQDGELLKRIKALRRKFAQDMGFLPATIHICDNLELKPSAYRILLKGVVVGEGEAHTEMLLAINPGRVALALPGTATRDPAFGLPAVWIENSARDQAQAAGYTVVDAGTVVATHISHVLQRHSAELLGRAEAQQLLDHLARNWPKLAEDLVPKLLPLATFQRVLQNLLSEGVRVRDLRSIAEALAEHAARTQDAAQLTAAVRVALGGAIVQDLFDSAPEIQVLGLAPDLERVLLQAAQSTDADGLGLEPGLAATLMAACATATARQESLGTAPVLLVADRLRQPLSRLARRSVPQLKVLAHAEIPDNRTVRVTSFVGEQP